MPSVDGLSSCSSSIDMSLSPSPLQAGTSASSSAANREREDKLLNAKRKLKSYRARQSKANNAPGSPSSPSKNLSSTGGSTSSITSAKRSSFIQPTRPIQSHGREKSLTTSALSGGKIAHGHAHRRSHSRNLSISTSSNGPLTSSMPNGQSPRELAKEREARRASLIFGKIDPAAVANACATAAAAASATGSTSPSMSTSGGSTTPQIGNSATNTPTQSTTPTQASTQASSSSSSSAAISDYHANRRNSRRHSRTSSISISIAPSTFDGFAAVSPSGASPRKLSYPSPLPPHSTSALNAATRCPKSSSNNGSFPSSASSPALSASLASFTLGQGSSNPNRGNRQSVPAFATAAQTTLQNGRIVLSAQQQAGISPQTSPQPPQHAFAGSFSATSSTFSGGNAMLNPSSALKSYRRASLGVPKSPSFFESQQLAASLSEQGSATSPSSISPSSTSTTPTSAGTAASSSHARKNSRHSRRISVSTRRESMEIMAGIIPGLLPSSPNPDIASVSAEMNRLNNSTNSSSGASGPLNGYDDTVLGSSLAMEERQLSEEEERDFALSRLEGRLSVRPDLIQLPDEETTTATTRISSTSDDDNGTAAKLLSSTRSEKRNSWNPRDSWGSTSPFAINHAGMNKTGNLDMLVEEEEEDEEEMEEEQTAEFETETEREASTTEDLSIREDVEEEQHVTPADVQEAVVAPGQKRQRPGSLAFPPRKLSLSSPTNEEKVVSPPASASSSSHSSVKIGGQRVPPRPLSLISSSSMGNLSNVSADVKSARRQSGLRSLTLTSPEHVLNGPSSSTSPALTSGTLARRRQSLLLNNAVSPASNTATSPSPSSNNNNSGGIRPFSISSTSSILSPDSSFRSNFQFGSSTKETQLQSQQQAAASSILHNGLPVRTRKSFSNASNASIASSAISTPSRTAGSSAPPLTTTNAASSASIGNAARPRFGRRFSDLASPSSAGFGDLVMEESLIEEDEDQLDEDDEIPTEHEKILDGLHRGSEDDDSITQKMDYLTAEAGDMTRGDSSMTNISVSDDPVILDLQVRALKSQVEHLRAQLSTSDSARKEEVESLRYELSEVKENMLNAEEEREMLREDIDGWRTRCADLERALQSERAKLDDERREGMLLREKVRKLGDRLAQGQNGPLAATSPDGSATSPDGTIDASLVNAQAKLIGEMRDQIFSLAAALERERLKNAGETRQDESRSSSPLLRALASQDEKIAATLREDEAAEAVENANRAPHHNTSTQSSAASGSYNFSSSFSSIHSQMGNNTEDTSIGDDNDSMYGSKSPSSPAFWASSPTPSYSQMSSSGGNNASNGISIHASSAPLRNSDLCMNYGGLQTLAEEDEEDMQDEDINGEIAEVNAQAKKALSLSDLSEEEENDAVPELVHEELSQRRADFEALRARTQSASTGSSMDTNDHMPLTPAKEHSSPNLPAQTGAQQHQSKPSHHRSDSFIKQWSFPKGPVEPLDLTEHHHNDSFWALYQGSLPPLPLSASLVEAPPFSAEITLDEEYFHMATAKPLPASRPSSTVSIPSRPPMSRSNSQATKLKEEIDPHAALLHASPAGTSGSRLSLQGFSNLWGNYLRGPQTPPIPEHAVANFSPSPSKPAVVQQKPLPQLAPATGRKPLLRLQPSPIGNLNFAHAASCCTDANGKGHRILRL